MNPYHITQIINIIGPLSGVIVGGLVTYMVQTSLAKQNDIKAIFSKLFGLKKLLKQLYISRKHAEALHTYYFNMPRFQDNEPAYKEFEKIEAKFDRLDIDIAKAESELAETCGRALIIAKTENDKVIINNLLNHPDLISIEAAFTTLGENVKNIVDLREWHQERRKEVIQTVEEKINACFSPVESLELFKF